MEHSVGVGYIFMFTLQKFIKLYAEFTPLTVRLSQKQFLLCEGLPRFSPGEREAGALLGRFRVSPKAIYLEP